MLMTGENSTRILIVDDEEGERRLLAEIVGGFGFAAVQACDGQSALEAQAQCRADVIVTDLVMPGMDGFELLRSLQSMGDTTPTIVLTGFGNIDKAISVVHDLKAFWFLEKPVQPNVLRVLLDRAATQKRLMDETSLLQRQLSNTGMLGNLVGSSVAMRQVYSLVRQVAPTSASVLITGESGTGKELVARAIHRLSGRSAGPFIAVNCAALPETLIESELFGHEKGSFTGAVERYAGCFEQAHNGTVFLDEIAEMEVGTQAKLLRVLEEGKVRRIGGKEELKVETRVIAATNRPPEQAIADKLLREDLYYRLNVFHIALPPLRQHREDIPEICEAMIVNLNHKHDCRITGISPEVLGQFQDAPWPGNVRQLRNIVERCVIVAHEGMIVPRHLPMEVFVSAPAAQPPAECATVDDSVPVCVGTQIRELDDSIQASVGVQIHELEDAYIKLVLKHTNHNRTRAAELLGISRRTLQSRIREFSRRAKTVSAG